MCLIICLYKCSSQALKTSLFLHAFVLAAQSPLIYSLLGVSLLVLRCFLCTLHIATKCMVKPFLEHFCDSGRLKLCRFCLKRSPISSALSTSISLHLARSISNLFPFYVDTASTLVLLHSPCIGPAIGP